MSTFFFSGVDRPSFVRILAQEQAVGMVSQLDWSRGIDETLLATGIPFVVDSGAYSKVLDQPDIKRYAQLIVSLGNRATWYASPDCIGDQDQSNANYAYLLSLLPAELHGRVLWIYQCSADISYLHEGLHQHKQVGIGGLVPLFKSNEKQKAEQVVGSLASIIQAHGAIPQYFGCGVASIVKSLAGIHEDFSVDSATWLAGNKFGLAIDTQGRQWPVNSGGFDWDKEAILRQNVRTMRKWIETGVSGRASYCQQSLWEVA